jgi:hypothetical protein
MESKRIIWLSLLAVALMLVSQASAVTETLLPASSLYDGYTYYGEAITMQDGSTSYMQGRIDFAVYDTTAGNEWAGAGFTNPGNGKYVYAYQIFNDYDGYSEVPIQAFSVFGLDGAEISVIAGSVVTEEDPLGGQDASDTALSDTTVTWNFSLVDLDNDYTIGTDGHSFFLIFSSDYSWTKGDYSLEAYNPEFPVAPGGDDSATGGNGVPEPVTVVLLGLGGLVAVAKRKRK